MNLIIVPAFNEEKNIGRVIRGLFENGHRDIIVVDDGSTDSTSTIAEHEGAAVIKHGINRGQGAALETGNEYARSISADSAVHFDADGQFNPSDIQKALDFMNTNKIDVVLGSRFMGKSSGIPFFKKYFILPIARLVNVLFGGILLTDAHNGFRILNKKALNTIRIKQDRMAHNTEIIQQIRKTRLNYAEFPVEVRYAEYGQGALQGFKILQDLILGLFN